MHVYLWSVAAPAVVVSLTVVALPNILENVTDQASIGGVTIVEKTPAAERPAPTHVSKPLQVRPFLTSQAFTLDLRPWQFDAWNRYEAALAALYAPLKSPPTNGDPIEAFSRIEQESIARGPAATTLASAADDLRDQLRPDQIVRASSLIPPPWRFIDRAELAGLPNSAEASPPRPSAERAASQSDR